jgi:hypothetical protein
VSQEHLNKSDETNSALSHRKGEDPVIAALEAAADEGDSAAFAASLAVVDSERLFAKDFIRIMRLALKAGAYLDARQVSVDALKRYPDDDEVKKFARVLAPPRVLASNLPPDPDVEANQAWLTTHHGEYSGRWVALRGGDLLGAGVSLKELIALVGETKGVLLTVAR